MKTNNHFISAFTKTNRKYFMAVLFLTVLCYSCSHKVQSTSSAPAKTAVSTISKLTPEQMQAGSTLYAAKCQRCHKLHETTEYNASKWDRMITAMAPKAKLTEEETGTIRSYILNSPLHQ